VTKIGELGTTQAATSNRRTLRNNPEDTILQNNRLVAIIPQAKYPDRVTAAVGKASADFCYLRLLRGQRSGSLRLLISVI
jgi:hypothetical protein